MEQVNENSQKIRYRCPPGTISNSGYPNVKQSKQHLFAARNNIYAAASLKLLYLKYCRQIYLSFNSYQGKITVRAKNTHTYDFDFKR